jgi:pimeloyl-ACP methyl ester carboxylesterase
MGVSGGAPHAIACAAVLGERITDLTIVSGVAPPDCWAPSRRPTALETFLGALMRHAGWVFALLAAPLFWFARRLPHLFLRIYRRVLPEADRGILTRPEVAAAYRDEIRRLPRTAVAAVVQDLALFAGPWGHLIDRVDQPTTVWHGGKDRAVPVEHAIAVSERLENARITVFPADGHLMLCDRAAAILGDQGNADQGALDRPLSEVR